MSTKNRRQKRFDAFDAIAARLQTVDPSHPPNTILCPICLASFARGAIDSGVLTAEHVIPKRLGSAAWTLGCRRCNNDNKRNLESHLTSLIRFEDVNAGVSGDTLRGCIRAANGKQNVRVSIESSGPTVTLSGSAVSAQSPKAQNLVRAFESGIRSFDLLMHGDFDQRLAELSLLKSAYLFMFSAFGYDYILRSQLDIVRRQLRRPFEEIVPRAAVFRFAEAPPMCNERVTRFVIVNPSFLIVALNLSTAQPRHYAVILPSRKPTEPHIYDIFTNEFAEKYRSVRLESSSASFDMSTSDEW